MNKKTLVTIIFFLQIMICWNLNAAPVRQQINLNRGWLFPLGDVEGAEQTSFSDQSWEQVNLHFLFLTSCGRAYTMGMAGTGRRLKCRQHGRVNKYRLNLKAYLFKAKFS